MSRPGGRTTSVPSFDPKDVLDRNLIFVSGKGGVGKTSVSRALARSLAKQGHQTLWTTFEDPLEPDTSIRQVAPNLSYLNCEATAAFEEYVGLKIGIASLTRIFLQNKLTRYLAKAAPGIHELVLLGKVWFERENFDHVVVDMPSTGYGLAMFQSCANFARLFKGGPIHRDAIAMLETFRDPQLTGQLIVSLPEEMPLRESVELSDYLEELFPDNACAFLVNRLFPGTAGAAGDLPDDTAPHAWSSPLARDARDYATKRSQLERYNLRIWEELKIRFASLDMIPPSDVNPHEFMITELSAQLAKKGLV